MSKNKNRPSNQTEALAMTVGNFRKALESVQQMNETAIQQQPIFEERFLTSEGQIIPQEELTRFLLNQSNRNELIDYYSRLLELKGSCDFLRSSITQAAEHKSLRSQAILSQQRERQDGVLRQITEFVDRIEETNPLSDSKRDQDFFDTVSAMPLPLQQQDIALLDDVFGKPEDSEDVMGSFFLSIMAASGPNRFSSAGKNKVHVNYNEYLDNIADTAKNYLDIYYNRLLEARFSTQQKLGVEIFPEGSTLLPIVLGVSLARTSETLPQHFVLLIQEDFIPGLSKETKDELIAYYNERFRENRQKIVNVLDDDGYQPYLHSLDSVNNGSGLSYVRDLIQTYANAHPDESENDNDNIAWLIDKDNFSTIREYLNFIPHIGRDENIVAIDFSTYSPYTIDVTLIAQDERAYTISIDKEGRIIGLPLELQREGNRYVRYLIGRLREYKKAERDAVQQIPSRRHQPEKGKLLPKQAIVPKATALTHEQRIARYTQIQASISTKRKELRNQGLLPSLLEEEQTVLPQTSRRERVFNISLTPSATFLEQKAALPTHMQGRLDGILKRISTEPTYIRGHLKPLKEKDPRYPDVNAYSVRLGKDWRIIFVQSGVGAMLITSVEPRGRVYDNLRADYQEMIKNL